MKQHPGSNQVDESPEVVSRIYQASCAEDIQKRELLEERIHQAEDYFPVGVQITDRKETDIAWLWCSYKVKISGNFIKNFFSNISKVVFIKSTSCKQCFDWGGTVDMAVQRVTSLRDRL